MEKTAMFTVKNKTIEQLVAEIAAVTTEADLQKIEKLYIELRNYINEKNIEQRIIAAALFMLISEIELVIQ